MVQVVKRTMNFELFLRRNPGTVRVSTENSKDKVILARCAVFGPATAEFRFMNPATASADNGAFSVQKLFSDWNVSRYDYARKINPARVIFSKITRAGFTIKNPSTVKVLGPRTSVVGVNGCGSNIEP